MKRIRFLSIILVLCLAFGIMMPCALAVPDEEIADNDGDAVAADSSAVSALEDKAEDRTVYAGAPDAPEIDAVSALLIDIDSGVVLYSIDPDKRINPASVTKMMTCLLVVEALEQGAISSNDMVTATADCFDDLVEDGSSVGIKEGESMSVHDLLYCAMLSSANEAANILAKHVSAALADGTISGFVKMMNERAEELGCTDTHFENPHGITVKNHYTTANDLARIAVEALKHQQFYEVCNTAEYTVAATDMSPSRNLNNSNALINRDSVYGEKYYYEYAFGIKTGHTDAAGYCLVSAADKDDIRLLSVVMGSKRDELGDERQVRSFTNAIDLYNWAYESFSKRVIVSADAVVGTQTVKIGDRSTNVGLCPISDLVALVPNNLDVAELTKGIELNDEEVQAPVKKGDELGRLSITDSEGNDYGSVRLVAAENVSQSQSDFLKSSIIELLDNMWVKLGLAALVLLIVLIIVGSVISKKKKSKKNNKSKKNSKHSKKSKRKSKKNDTRKMNPDGSRDYYAEFFEDEHSWEK